MQSKTWKICDTWGIYGGLHEDSRFEEYDLQYF